MRSNHPALRQLERQFIRHRILSLGLQMPEYWILHMLDTDGRLRQEDIAYRSSMDKGAVARTVARLETLELVERQVSPQCRREKLVGLTPLGESLALRIQETLREWEQVCFQDFSEAERALYESFLLRIIQNAQKNKRGDEHNGERLN